jgi:hypothetical protein
MSRRAVENANLDSQIARIDAQSGRKLSAVCCACAGKGDQNRS